MIDRSDFIKILNLYTSKKKSPRLKRNQQNWDNVAGSLTKRNFLININLGIQIPGPQQIRGKGHK